MPSDKSVFVWQLTSTDNVKREGSLAELRLGVKDLFDIAGLPTGAGNPDWLATHPIPDQTSPVVKQLLSEGAVLVGKTQTDELAYSLNGVNIHYGAAINPVCPNRLAGGSSSGSAVAVAAHVIDIGLGTDTGGSIRVPASYNGLYGIRTSHGVIDKKHVVPLAPRFDTVGWMTRDAVTLERVGQVLLPDAQVLFDKPMLRVAVLCPELEQPLWTHPHERWLLAQPNLTVVKRVQLTSEWLNRASTCFRILQGREIWKTHGEWITHAMPTFAPDIDARFKWCSTLTQEDEKRAEHARVCLLEEINTWFFDVDLVVLPTTPGPAPLLDADAHWMDIYRSQLMGLTAAAGLAGFPQVHLPVLQQDGAPYGISLLGRAGDDKALLQLATAMR